jgi:hypothetical protein
VIPSDAARRILSAIFALVAGVLLPTSICATADSRTERMIETNSGPNFVSGNFGNGEHFRIKILRLMDDPNN